VISTKLLFGSMCYHTTWNRDIT